ncbi:MAG: Methyl-accepting chemotaxis protein McpA [Candidatus Heimdallarchaeota archaeon LC_3]|nr:MAG: Methyl-accepting chemotaxis protein McpA [Candidatus Heimdallarchaeota archaeon LC_3]
MAIITIWKNLSLQFKILALVVLLVILPILATSTYLFGIHRPELIAETEEQLLEQVVTVTNRFSSVIQEQNELVHVISEQPDFSNLFNASSPEEYDKALKETTELLLAFGRHLDNIAQVRFLNATGWELIRINVDIDRGEIPPGEETSKVEIVTENMLSNKGGSSYFIDNKDAVLGQEYMSNINLNKEGTQVQKTNEEVVPVVRHATPYYFNGNFKGVLVMNFYVQPFFDSITAELTELYSKSGISIIDSKGDYLFNTNGDTWTGSENTANNWVSGDSFKDIYGSTLVSELFSNGDESTFIQGDNIFVSRRINLEFFDETFEIFSVMITPVSFVTAGIDNALFTIVTILISIGIIGFLIAYFIARTNIVNPLIKLARNSKTISDGDLSTEIDFKNVGDDEIGQLSVSFGTMVEFLKNTVNEISNTANTLATSSQEMASSAEEVNATSEEISSITQQMSQGSQQQSLKSTESAMLVEELQNRFNEKVENIETLSNIIEGINGKINMLALNASIEAARAGEYGRGFAVVAENIRQLAEEGKNSVSKVNEITSDLRSTLESSIKSIYGSIQEVAAISEETASGAEEASAATEEQAATMQEMSSTAQELANIATDLDVVVKKFKIK